VTLNEEDGSFSHVKTMRSGYGVGRADGRIAWPWSSLPVSDRAAVSAGTADSSAVDSGVPVEGVQADRDTVRARPSAARTPTGRGAAERRRVGIRILLIWSGPNERGDKGGDLRWRWAKERREERYN
jgi:hypothetical protein